MQKQKNSAPVEWAISTTPVAYEYAVAVMEARADQIARGSARELVWLLEHPPLYTAGTSSNPQDLLTPERFPVHKTGRGGQFTYHGPGQRVAYCMLDVKRRTGDVRAFVKALEGWIIETLRDLDVTGEIRDGRVGVWVKRPDKAAGDSIPEDKVAAIGIRVRRWVSFHGLAINVAPDLEHFSGIVPCGIAEHGVTSLSDLGKPATLARVDATLRAAFERRFGPTQDAPVPELATAPAS